MGLEVGEAEVEPAEGALDALLLKRFEAVPAGGVLAGQMMRAHVPWC